MHGYTVIVLFVSAVFSSTPAGSVEWNGTDTSGATLEVLSAQLTHMRNKLVELEAAMKEDRAFIDQKLNGIVNALQTQLASKEDLAWFKIDPDRYYRNISISSCTKYPSNRSGKHMIQPTRYVAPFLAYCEQTVFGGGWLVFQYRFDGSLDFYRSWIEYRNGFGSIDGEFWLGLENLYQLTSARPHELLVELKDFNGSYSYARYSEFEISGETYQYHLNKLGSFTGTAEDAFGSSRGNWFSTMDKDNDRSYENCATTREGGWWYDDCGDSNLNGPYRNKQSTRTVGWGVTNFKAHAYARMMIREL